jgi:hypothetical protein
MWRHLAVEVGMSKITGGQESHIKPIGCGASRAYAPGPDDEEEEDHGHLISLTNNHTDISDA